MINHARINTMNKGLLTTGKSIQSQGKAAKLDKWFHNFTP